MNRPPYHIPDTQAPSPSPQGRPSGTARVSGGHTGDSRTILGEVSLVYTAVSLVTWALTQAAFALGENVFVPLAIAMLFMWLPLRLARRYPEGAIRYNIDLGGILEKPSKSVEAAQVRAQPGPVYTLIEDISELATLLWRNIPLACRELGAALGIMLVVFPIYIFCFWWWHEQLLDVRLPAFTGKLPRELWPLIFTQVIVVGLPEEILFRGYIQSRLHEAFPPRRKILGAPLSWRVLLLQAFLFAFIHVLVDANWFRMTVFFPGLLFGWIRAKRGGMGAAALVHAFSNVLSETLAINWLR